MTTDDISKSLNSGNQVEMADFSKAFDKRSHERLSRKLKYTTQKKFCITKFYQIFKCHFFLSIPKLNFKFDTVLEDSIQYRFGSIMWKSVKSVKLHFSVSSDIKDILKVCRFF